MRVKSISSVCGVALVTAALTGCGSSAAATESRTSSPPPNADPVAASASGVYAWGNFSGGGAHSYSKLPGWRKRSAGARGGSNGGHPPSPSPVAIHGITGTVRQIATSNSDGYALTSSGAVFAWGLGAAGELGDGTPTKLSTTAVRVRFPAGVKIASLPSPMPFDAGMAIDTDGHVWGWGNDQNREFCGHRSANLDTPVKVPLGHVTKAIGAQRHALYLTGGRLLSCGYGQYGELGDGMSGTIAQSNGPVAVKGLPRGRISALTSAFGNAGALMADGAYYDWGLGSGGQVGNGAQRNAATAVHVRLPGRVVRVSQGGSVAKNGQTLALLSNGQLWEWGTGSFGQLADGGTSGHARPVRLAEPGGARFISFSSGGGTVFAIDRAGHLWAWGDNAQGELGNGSSAALSSTPVKDSLRVSQVTSTADNVAALAKRHP